MKPRPGRLMWWIVLALVAVQLYIVQELLAALALFTVVFLAFALLVGMVRLLHLGWERLSDYGEDPRGALNRRLFRRPRSATAR